MRNVYLGYSKDDTVRISATSGGVGSAIVKYLFETKRINYALSFSYNEKDLCYDPILIKKYSDYQISGSIYHEVNLIRFFKDAVKQCKPNDKICLFCLPCQARAIRQICKQANIDTIIIGLTCSSQQSIEATYFLLKKIGIDRRNVKYIQYRGNGWPSGIQIMLNNGNIVKIANNNSIWTKIFHSKLFVQKRCFFCSNTLNEYSDIVLADPWLREIVQEEKIGATLFGSYTEIGEMIIKSCITNEYISVKTMAAESFFLSQKKTIYRKSLYRKYSKLIRYFSRAIQSPVYLKLIESSFIFDLHCFIVKKVENLTINRF